MQLAAGGGLAGSVVAAGLALLVLVGAGAAPASQDLGTPTPAAASSVECDARALLEAPAADRPLRGVVTVGGWAVDLASPTGTGVSDVHVYLDGYGNEPGHTFIGRAEYGGSRVDVAQLFNDARFARSAFSLSWDASTAGAGPHTLVVLYRTRCGWASLTQVVEVDGPTIMLTIDAPPQGSPIIAPVRIEGWAADPRADAGTGVDRVDLYLDGQITTRGVPLGEVRYGESRPDVGAALGGDGETTRARFSRSGFALLWNPTGVAPGLHSLTFYASGAAGAVARSLTVEVTAAAATARATPLAPGGGTPGRAADSFGLAVAGSTSASVSLIWAPVAGAVSYEVYASEGVAAFFIAQSGITAPRATVSGLAPGRPYRFFVRALDVGGNELAHSTAVSITTGTVIVTPAPQPTITPRPSPTIPNQF